MNIDVFVCKSRMYEYYENLVCMTCANLAHYSINIIRSENIPIETGKPESQLILSVQGKVRPNVKNQK